MELRLPHRTAEDISLEEARKRVLDGCEDGIDCPCCGRLVKLSKRRLHAEMAAFLCRLVARYQRAPRYFSTRELCPAQGKSSTDGSYLVLWDLVEKEPSENKNASGGRAGMYRPTQHGIDFVHRRTSVKSHVFMLSGNPVGFSERWIDIDEALGSRFNYQKLMEG